MLIVYAVNDRNSFLAMENWIELVRNYGSTNVKIILIANKSDLEK